MAKKKAYFRVWIDRELHAPLIQLAKEHASTVPRQTNRILKDHFAPKAIPPAMPEGDPWGLPRSQVLATDCRGRIPTKEDKQLANELGQNRK